VHPQRSYLCALSVPSSFSRLIHELNELFSVNKGATLVAMTSIPRSSYMCRRTSVRGSRMWTRPLTEGVRPWSWFAIASKSRSVERSDDRMIAQRTVYISSSERLISYERTVGFSDKRSSPGKENRSKGKKQQVPPLRFARSCDFFIFRCSLRPESSQEHLPGSIAGVLRLRAMKPFLMQ
jgi:hypothetical protein